MKTVPKKPAISACFITQASCMLHKTHMSGYSRCYQLNLSITLVLRILQKFRPFVRMGKRGGTPAVPAAPTAAPAPATPTPAAAAAPAAEQATWETWKRRLKRYKEACETPPMPFFKPNRKKKGTRIVKGLLTSLAQVSWQSRPTRGNPTHYRGLNIFLYYFRGSLFISIV